MQHFATLPASERFFFRVLLRNPAQRKRPLSLGGADVLGRFLVEVLGEWRGATSRLDADLCSAEVPGPVDFASVVLLVILRYGLLQWRATA